MFLIEFITNIKRLFKTNNKKQIEYKYYDPKSNYNITWTYDEYVIKEKKEPCEYCINPKKNNHICFCFSSNEICKDDFKRKD